VARPQYIHRVRVSYIDTDAAQVVHHATYLRYFEQARVEFLRANGWDYNAWLKREGLGLPVAENTVKYRAPAYFDDQLDVHTWVAVARRSALIFQYEIRRDGKLLTEGSTKCACTTMGGSVRRVPDALLRVCLGDEYDPALV
jgi:acyl-CoA thioester hydrolase